MNALITGITGQDGLYLAELLSNKGYNIVGVVSNLNQALKRTDLALKNNKVHLLQCDMNKMECIADLLGHFSINEVYNLAAYSSGVGMYDDPIAIGEVNGLTVVRILEAIRITDLSIKMCQASSSEIFGETTDTPQTEETKFNPRSPYGAAKLYAHNMVRIFRQRYGIFACSAILYNHESPRRRPGFVSKKIIHEVVRIKLGLSSKLRLGNLDSFRDWGFAGDYVNAMWLMLQNTDPDDYIIATGEMHSVREFCDYAFSYFDLDYRDYVSIERDLYRPAETTHLVGNARKAREVLRWSPKVEFPELIKMMIDKEIETLNQQEKLKGS